MAVAIKRDVATSGQPEVTIADRMCAEVLITAGDKELHMRSIYMRPERSRRLAPDDMVFENAGDNTNIGGDNWHAGPHNADGHRQQGRNYRRRNVSGWSEAAPANNYKLHPNAATWRSGTGCR